MKLRNKKTGEIVEPRKIGFEIYSFNERNYDSLAELNEEWEDYEDSEESYYIDCDGEIYEPVRLNKFDLDRMTNIGNYFKTREEAEKAVGNLKAWKRLKDAGFKFISYNFNKLLADEENIDIKVILPECDSFKDDLDLLFGGEE